MIDLVIFDLDGVLVDACDIHKSSLNKALKKISNYEISDEDHINVYNGIPTKVKLKKLIELDKIKAKDIEKIEDLKQKYTIDCIKESCNNRIEKIELLSYLKNNSIKIACYTNSIKKTAELMLKKTGIYNFFDLIITNEDVDNPKPNPEGYNKILSILNIEKNKTIIIEDSENGYIAAISSGCNVIRVKNQDFVDINLFKDIL